MSETHPLRRNEPLKNKAKVLLVDDHPENLLALRTLLADFAQNLVEANSGYEALQKLLEDEFAAILLDVSMPGMDGFETATLIRGHWRSAHTPIIFLTAHEMDRSRIQQGYALGAVDFLVKPLIPEALRAKVAGFVELFNEKHKAQREADELRLLIQGTAEYAIFMLDAEGNVASWNPGAERIKGYRSDEIIGQHFSVFYLQDEIGRRWPQHDLEIARHQGRFEGEGWRVRKDGTQFWASEVITALKDEVGKLRGFSKLTRDMTEKNQANENVRRLLQEEAARRTAEQNAQIIQEQQERLRASEEELRRADQRKDEFLATLAHELRNPLAPIRNALELQRRAGNNLELIQRCRSMMERQVTHLVRLVDDLIDINRITRRKLELRKERIELAAVINSAVETSQPLIEQGHHQLSVNLPTQAINLDADLIRLAQVFSNLLNNSAKYTPAGGRIDVMAENQGEYVVVRVRDNGIGIPQEALPRIFEMFSQVESALERSKGGLGIGLALVRQLVEMHDGSIEATSEGTGKGSEFVVRLPIAKEVLKTIPDVSLKQSPVLKQRILVVDDNVDSATSLGTLLEVMGHEVSIAHDGLAALETAKAFRPDLIFLDIGLPGISGYETCRRMREQSWGQEIVIVALTGWGQDEDRGRSRECGFDQHLTKPIGPSVLETQLIEAQAGRRAISKSQ